MRSICDPRHIRGLLAPRDVLGRAGAHLVLIQLPEERLEDPPVVGVHEPWRGLPELLQLRLQDLSSLKPLKILPKSFQNA